MKLIDVLFAVFLFGFIITYYAALILEANPDESKPGRFIKKYKPHRKKFLLLAFILFVLTIVTTIL